MSVLVLEVGLHLVYISEIASFRVFAHTKSVRSYYTSISGFTSGFTFWVYDFGFTFWVYDFGFTILGLRFGFPSGST